MNINDKLAQYGLDVFSNRPVFVYGDNVEASKKTTTAGRDMVKKVNGKDEYRALGYAVDGSVFPNPSFPYDNEGHAAKDKMWVKEPWNGFSQIPAALTVTTMRVVAAVVIAVLLLYLL